MNFFRTTDTTDTTDTTIWKPGFRQNKITLKIALDLNLSFSTEHMRNCHIYIVVHTTWKNNWYTFLNIYFSYIY